MKVTLSDGRIVSKLSPSHILDMNGITQTGLNRNAYLNFSGKTIIRPKLKDLYHSVKIHFGIDVDELKNLPETDKKHLL